MKMSLRSTHLFERIHDELHPLHDPLHLCSNSLHDSQRLLLGQCRLDMVVAAVEVLTSGFGLFLRMLMCLMLGFGSVSRALNFL